MQFDKNIQTWKVISSFTLQWIVFADLTVYIKIPGLEEFGTPPDDYVSGVAL